MRRLTAVLVAGFLWIGFAAIAQAQTSSASSINEWRKSDSRSDDTAGLDARVTSVRAGQTAWFLFGEGSGTATATTGTSKPLKIEEGSDAIICLNPDVETETVPETGISITTYLMMGSKNAGKLFDTFTSIPLPSGNIDGTTCANVPGGSYIWLVYAIDAATVRSQVVVIGRGYEP